MFDSYNVGNSVLGISHITFRDCRVHIFFPTTFLEIAVYMAISRKAVGKNVHATIPKVNMGYDQYNVPDIVAVENAFVAFV